MPKDKPQSLMAACREYFGLLPGQTTMQFAVDYKTLSDDDKAEIKSGLEKEGFQIS